MEKTVYKGFSLETTLKGEAQQTLIFDSNGNPAGGCFSHLDKTSSLDKAKAKIDFALMFNVPIANVSEQYEANAKELTLMHEKALKTGKKYNGYTAEQLAESVEKYKCLAGK